MIDATSHESEHANREVRYMSEPAAELVLTFVGVLREHQGETLNAPLIAEISRAILNTVNTEPLELATNDLAGIGELAEVLGVTKQRVHQLARSDGFPKPVANLRATPVYLRSEVVAFRETRRATPGPVPK
jgi:hypothetical protein